jgi:hypothetical protein
LILRVPSGFVRSLPPLQEVAAMAGVELPEFLGKVAPGSSANIAPGVTEK